MLPLLLVMYGAGVLLIREAVVRVRGGWASLVLLGVAYEIAEDGLGLQALTSPVAYGAADWGWRTLGLNLTYWCSQVFVHVVLSVLVPVALTALIFPDLRGRPYLLTGGLCLVAARTIVGVVGVRVLIGSYIDPGYQQSWPWTAGFCLAIAGLAFLALPVVAPTRRPAGPDAKASTPPAAVVGLTGAVLTAAFLATVFPFGLASELLLGDLVPPGLRLAVAALIALGFGALVLSWRRAPAWGDQHDVWLIGGILVAHTAVVMVGPADTVLRGAITLVVEVGLLALLARSLRRRADAPRAGARRRVGVAAAAHAQRSSGWLRRGLRVNAPRTSSPAAEDFELARRGLRASSPRTST